VVHLGYLPNLATADAALYALSTERLLRELLLARGPGLDSLKIIQLNDSRAPCDSRRDRHWHLGRGAIGLAGFRHFFSHPWLKPEAAIMETPKQHQAQEWYNLLVARSLVAGTPLLPAGQAG
jgi:deoxyribonuclease-4